MQSPFRVAVLDDYQGVGPSMADWSSLGSEVDVTFFADHVADAEQLVSRLRGFDAVVAMRERTAFSRSVLSRLPALRLLVTAGMANAVIDLAAAGDLGIVVCGTQGRYGMAATVELTWGLILATVRGIPREDAGVRHGGWQLGVGTVLGAKTLGIVGLGHLGRAVIPVARAFGMDVIAWSRNLTAERAEEVGVEPVGREELFRRSDVVTVHLKLSARSVGYIGREELGLMRRSAHLVNTSRGPVVDEAALVEALEQRRIAGAALDVFDREPLPADHPLRYLPNVVLSPHLGYVSQESYREFFDHFVEDIAAFRRGEPVRVIRPD